MYIMINMYEFASDRVHDLPQDFVDDIINILNQQREEIEYWIKRNAEAVRLDKDKFEIKYTFKMLELRRNELKVYKKFLNTLDLHPVYDVPCHRRTYSILDFNECDAIDDYLRSMGE